jgi:hypothetical protein
MMLVLIDGEGASGKTVLRSLLDGHPELSVLPFHDMVIDTLVAFPPDVPWLAYRDTPYLRRMLAASSYYQLEQLAQQGSIEIDISVSDRIVFPFDFDFGRFDATWMRELYAAGTWTVPLIVERIHRAYLAGYEGSEREARGYVGVGFDNPATPHRLFAYAPDARLVYLRRPVADVLAARANRRSTPREMMSLENDTMTVETLLRKGKVRKMRERLRAVERLRDEHPGSVLVLDFHPLVEDTANTMREVAAFLGIREHDTLTQPTLLGRPLVAPNGRSFVGRVLDRAEDLLSPRERALIAMDEDWRTAFQARRLTDPGLLYRAAQLRAWRAWQSYRPRFAYTR